MPSIYLDKIISFQNRVIDFILNPQFQGILLFVKTFFILVSLAMTIIIVFVLIKSTWWKRFFWEDFVETFTRRPYGAKRTYKRWTETQKRLETGREEEYKLALIEADAVLDEVLKEMGYKGENISDRLKQIDSSVLPNIDEVQEANKTRNDVVYDPDYRLTLDTTKKAMEIYEKALQDLEAF